MNAAVLTEMTDGMGQNQKTCDKMEPGTGTFQLLEGRMNDRKGYGVHKAGFAAKMQKKRLSINLVGKNIGVRAQKSLK